MCEVESVFTATTVALCAALIFFGLQKVEINVELKIPIRASETEVFQTVKKPDLLKEIHPLVQTISDIKTQIQSTGEHRHQYNLIEELPVVGQHEYEVERWCSKANLTIWSHSSPVWGFMHIHELWSIRPSSPDPDGVSKVILHEDTTFYVPRVIRTTVEKELRSSRRRMLHVIKDHIEEKKRLRDIKVKKRAL